MIDLVKGFNGAAVRRPRRVDVRSPEKNKLAKASMGPRSEDRGEVIAVSPEAPSRELQWGRGPKTAESLAPKSPQFPVKAKAVIHIFAEGGPSHVDTWDPKPELAKFADKTLPGLDGLAFPSPFKFNKMGKSGIEVSEVFPKLGECVDDMAIIRSLWTDIPAHEVAQRFMHTGSLQLPKPSMGSWVVYGLGTENQNMPGFITLSGKPEWRQA